MSRCSIRPYRQGDLDHLCPALTDCAAKSRAWTAMKGMKPVMVAGMFPLVEGVVEGWAVSDQVDKRLLYTITQFISVELPKLMEGCNIHRIQAHVDPTVPGVAGFMTRIGMEYRTILPCATSDKRDLALFDMVR